MDAGPLIALGAVNDAHHEACAKVMEERRRETFLVSPLVVTEVCQLLERRVGPEAEARFLDSLVGSSLRVADLDNEDFIRMAGLVRQYQNFPLGAADASVVALAERYDVDTVMTVDHRHFRAVRPLHVEHFEILP